MREILLGVDALRLFAIADFGLANSPGFDCCGRRQPNELWTFRWISRRWNAQKGVRQVHFLTAEILAKSFV